ncbi:MAG: UxaA family hydrolase, partial [Clostridia bacterium]|nr:UxaA family hydrolase [Clostridia bacterium]
MKRFIIMNADDNVATALEDCQKGETAIVYDQYKQEVVVLDCLDHITYGNKMALKDIYRNDTILKYSLSIGTAVSNINKGKLVHVHNVKSNRIDIPEDIKRQIIE